MSQSICERCNAKNGGSARTTSSMHPIAVLGEFVEAGCKPFARLEGHLQSVKFRLAHAHADTVEIMQGELARVDIVFVYLHVEDSEVEDQFKLAVVLQFGEGAPQSLKELLKRGVVELLVRIEVALTMLLVLSEQNILIVTRG